MPLYISKPFGPEVATDLLNPDGTLQAAYEISNLVKDTLKLRGSRRSLIVGRKGSGKTTLLHMMDASVSVGCILNIGVDFPEVATMLAEDSRYEFTEPAAQVWSLVIKNTVINEIYKNHYHLIESLDVKSLSFLSKYIDSINSNIQRFGKTRLSEAADTVSDTVRNGYAGLAAAMLRSALNGNLDAEHALEIIAPRLRQAGTRVNVLIDTMEFYNIKSGKAANGCLLGLLHCCVDFHNQSDVIDCRLFFPDELSEHAERSVVNSVSKDFRDLQFLSWKAPELTCLAAMRLKDHAFNHFEIDWAVDHVSVNDTVEAQKLLHRICPVSVTNRTGVIFESVAYMLRHTQLNPRQFLTMLNALSSEFFEIDGGMATPSSQPIKEDRFFRIVAACANQTYGDVLATFREIYPRAGSICSRLLPSLGRTFSDKELKIAFDEHRILEDFGLHFEDVKASLSDIGAVGRVIDHFSNATTKTGYFAYTSHETLHLTASYNYCVHPIFSSVHPPMENDGLTIHPVGSGAHGE